MKGQVDTYKEVRTFEYPGWGTIRVHIPDLTEDERKRRHKELERAAARLLREVEKIEAQKNMDKRS